MCVGISLALTFLMGYYTYATLADYQLVEVVGQESLIIASGIDMVEFIWPLFALGIITGILLMLMWMKAKKML